jgi:hypothetical protein
MTEARDFCDRPIIYSRAEPDDEYDNPRPEPLDPYFSEHDNERHESDLDDEEELDEDEP